MNKALPLPTKKNRDIGSVETKKIALYPVSETFFTQTNPYFRNIVITYLTVKKKIHNIRITSQRPYRLEA